MNNPHVPIAWLFTRGVPISSGSGYRDAPCGVCAGAVTATATGGTLTLISATSHGLQRSSDWGGRQKRVTTW